MDVKTLVDALVLGLVEGLTEFIPVSSTGHILLLGHFLGFHSTGKAFEVLIQLGAILALVVVYFRRFWAIAKALPSNKRARRFVYGIVLAFIPAALLGVALHGIIKTVLFESPVLICTTLLVGGIVLLVVDRLPLKPRHRSAYELSPRLALGIGICQTVALVPGVSRSGATIVGAMLLGVEKRAAAEFSFFLALPTMAGAFTYDLYKNRSALSLDDGLIIAVGFAAAFLAAIVVIRRLLGFVQQRGYALFGWWRIVVALAGFAALFALGEIDPMAPFAGRGVPTTETEGGRLVTTTTIRAAEPVGELPLGPNGSGTIVAPTGGASPTEAPSPAEETSPELVPPMPPESDPEQILPPSTVPPESPTPEAPATGTAPAPATDDSRAFDDSFSAVPAGPQTLPNIRSRMPVAGQAPPPALQSPPAAGGDAAPAGAQPGVRMPASKPAASGQ